MLLRPRAAGAGVAALAPTASPQATGPSSSLACSHCAAFATPQPPRHSSLGLAHSLPATLVLNAFGR